MNFNGGVGLQMLKYNCKEEFNNDVLIQFGQPRANLVYEQSDTGLSILVLGSTLYRSAMASPSRPIIPLTALYLCVILPLSFNEHKMFLVCRSLLKDP